MGLSNSEVADRLLTALRASYPAARTANVVDLTVVPCPRPRSRPGWACRPSDRETTPICPNLALAGDWTHTDWAHHHGGCGPKCHARAVDLVHSALTAR